MKRIGLLFLVLLAIFAISASAAGPDIKLPPGYSYWLVDNGSYWQATLFMPEFTSSDEDDAAVEIFVTAMRPYNAMLFFCVPNVPRQCGVFAFKPEDKLTTVKFNRGIDYALTYAGRR